jgi:hypothetical protein
LATGGVAQDALCVDRAVEAAVPGALGVEGHVRPEVALTKARVADQTSMGLVLDQLDESLPEQ